MGVNLGGSKSSSKSSEYSIGNSSEKGNRDTVYDQGPWKAQSPHIQGIWNAAINMYNDQHGGRTGRERNLDDSVWDWSTKNFNDANRDFNQIQGRWNDLYSGQQEQQGKWNNLMGDLLGQNQQTAMDAAKNWAQGNPYLDQAVSSSWDNVNKTLQQDINGVGGLNTGAARTGNMDSSRAGVMEGVARSEAASAGQQNELALRQQAFDQGLGQYNNLQDFRRGLAGDMYVSPDQMGNIMRGQQDARGNFNSQQEFYMNQGRDAAYGDRKDQDINWQNLGNLWNMIGGQNWGKSGNQNEQWETEGRQESFSKGKTKGSSSSAGLSLGL